MPPVQANTAKFNPWLTHEFHAASELASQVVAPVIANARAEGQYWMGPAGSTPQPLGTPTLLGPGGIDLRGALRYASESFTVTEAPHGETRISIRAAIAGQRIPSEPDQLLADAMHIAFTAEVRNFGLSAVVAAMACEVTVKDFLRAHATPEQQALVEAVIDNPREVTVAASELYNLGIRSVVGRSLRDDDKAAFKALSALFSARNRYVHRGLDSPDLDSIRAHLEAARAALAYLRGIDRGLGPPT